MLLYGSWGLRDSNLVHDQQLVLLWIFPPHSSAVFLMSESKSYSIDNNNKVWQVFFKIGLFWLYFVQLFQKKSTTNWVWQCFTNLKSETAFTLKSISNSNQVKHCHAKKISCSSWVGITQSQYKFNWIFEFQFPHLKSKT